MSTLRIPVEIIRPDSTAFLDLIANQITEATSPSIGDLTCYVLVDGAADNGVYGRFSIPQNFVGTPKLVMRAVLDGSPGAADILGTGVRKRAVANNEAADGTFDAQELSAASVIGSNSLAYSDEDFIEQMIDLSAANYAVGDDVFFYFFLDVSVTTYAGNVLLLGLEFQYADA